MAKLTGLALPEYKFVLSSFVILFFSTLPLVQFSLLYS